METAGEEKHIIWEETYTILIIINSRRKIETNLQRYNWRKSPVLRELVERGEILGRYERYRRRNKSS